MSYVQSTAMAPQAAPAARRVPQEHISLAPRTTAGATSRRARLFEEKGWRGVRLVSDALLLVLGNLAALVGAAAADTSLDGQALIWAFPIAVIALMAVRGCYRDRMQVRLADGLTHVVSATSLAAIGLIAAATLLAPDIDSAPLIGRAWLFATVYLAAGRLLLAWAQRRARRMRLIAKPTLIVGAGVVSSHVEMRLPHSPTGLRPVGYLDGNPPPRRWCPSAAARAGHAGRPRARWWTRRAPGTW